MASILARVEFAGLLGATCVVLLSLVAASGARRHLAISLVLTHLIALAALISMGVARWVEGLDARPFVVVAHLVILAIVLAPRFSRARSAPRDDDTRPQPREGQLFFAATILLAMLAMSISALQTVGYATVALDIGLAVLMTLGCSVAIWIVRMGSVPEGEVLVVTTLGALAIAGTLLALFADEPVLSGALVATSGAMLTTTRVRTRRAIGGRDLLLTLSAAVVLMFLGGVALGTPGAFSGAALGLMVSSSIALSSTFALLRPRRQPSEATVTTSPRGPPFAVERLRGLAPLRDHPAARGALPTTLTPHSGQDLVHGALAHLPATVRARTDVRAGVQRIDVEVEYGPLTQTIAALIVLVAEGAGTIGVDVRSTLAGLAIEITPEEDPGDDREALETAAHAFECRRAQVVLERHRGGLTPVQTGFHLQLPPRRRPHELV